MRLIRQFESSVNRLFLQGRIPGTIHLSHGQEACAVGGCSHCGRTTASRSPTGGTVRRSPRGCRRGRSWRSSSRARPAAAGAWVARSTSATGRWVRCRRSASLGHPSPSRPAWAFAALLCRRGACDRLLHGRRRHHGGRRARGVQPRVVVATAGGLRVREQPVLHQHPRGTAGAGHIESPNACAGYGPARGRGRWQRCGRGHRRGVRSGRPRPGRRRAGDGRVPDVSAGRAQARRPCHVSPPRRGRGVAAPRPARAHAVSARCRGPRGALPTRQTRRSPRSSRTAIAFAEASPPATGVIPA